MYGQKNNLTYERTEKERKFCNSLKEFIQNEYNASLYYNVLAERTKQIDIKSLLKEISQNCCENEKAYHKLLQKLFYESFEAENKIMHVTFDLREEIKKGIWIETKELLKERRLYSRLSENNKADFDDTMYRRMWRLTNLQSIFCSIH